MSTSSPSLTTSEAAAGPLRVIDLGRLAYAPALERQRQLNQAVIDQREPSTLLLVEHDPVITISHRRDAGQHLLAPRKELDRLGIAIEQTDRGGDITYHGPGQLVAYPIVQLNKLGLNLSTYMRTLEQVVIDTLAHFHVHATRDACATGVWVATHAHDTTTTNTCATAANTASAKVCAMGVRVRKNTTMHGLALNVNPDLTHFQTIVPCGLHGRVVTSLANLLGDRAPTMDAVKRQLTTEMQRTIAALSQT